MRRYRRSPFIRGEGKEISAYLFIFLSYHKNLCFKMIFLYLRVQIIENYYSILQIKCGC